MASAREGMPSISEGMVLSSREMLLPSDIEQRHRSREIHDLMRNQVDLAEECDYDEAEAAAERASDLLQMEHQRQKEAMSEKHHVQREEMTETCLKELADFNEVWDRKDEEFEAHALESTMGQNNRAKERYCAYMQEVRATTKPVAPHHSSECIRLINLHKSLAKQRRFTEAKRVKFEADKLRKAEEQEWSEAREEKIKALEETFLMQQDREFNAYVMRLHNARSEQEKTRNRELGRLQQRHRNIKSQLEHEQVKSENHEEARQNRESMRIDTPVCIAPTTKTTTLRRPKEIDLSPCSSGLALLNKIMELRSERQEMRAAFEAQPSELQLPSASEKVALANKPWAWDKAHDGGELPAVSNLEHVHSGGVHSRYRG